MALLLFMIPLLLPDKSESTDIYGLLKSTATFICQYKANNERRIRWTKINLKSPDQVFAENARINNETLPAELYTRISVTGNHAAGEYNLNIANVIQGDGGHYTCGLTGTVGEQRFTFHVIDAPTSVVIDNKNITNNRILGTEGQNLKLKCTAVGGDPDPDVKLHIPGLSITPSAKRSVEYTISVVNKSYDGQTITCTGSNNPNTPVQRSDTTEIYLNLKPLPPIFSIDPVSTQESVPLVVSCTSSGNRPAGNFQWFIAQSRINVTKNSTQHKPSHDTVTDTYTVKSTLTVFVDRTYNNQKIECGISNAATENVVTTTKNMDIMYPPKITVQNATFQNTTLREIQCILDGNPDSYIFEKWQHKSVGGTLIRELVGSQKLILPSLPMERRYQDTGEYICTASNGIKDESGKLKQTGAGFVTSYAPPVVISPSNHTQYAAVGTSTDLHVNVYSIPKYSTRVWLKENKIISASAKYVMSERPAILHSVFHNKEVQVDGHTLTLTINSLTENDFTKYVLQLSNGIDQVVMYSVHLALIKAPKTPSNFALAGSTESTVTVEWNPVYNSGYDQIFHIEYRKQGSNVWHSVEIPQDQTNQDNKLSHTLDGLQYGTVFEVRIFSENQLNRSSFTNTETIQTMKTACSQMSFDHVIGGVVGGFLAVIFIMSVSFVFVFKKKPRKRKVKRKSTEKEYDNIGMEDNSLNDSKQEIQLQDKSQHERFAKYEDIGVADKPNVYDELKGEDRGQQVSLVKMYETLGAPDTPNVYDELKDKGAGKLLSPQKYETLGQPDKPNIYEELEK